MAQAIPLPAYARAPRVVWPAVALVATLAVGVIVERAAYPGDPAAAAGDLAVAVALVACGMAVWTSVRASQLTGALMVATGVAWLAGGVIGELALLHRGPLVQLLVTAPGSRPRTWVERLVVGAGYVDCVMPGVARDGGATVALAVVVAGVALARWARAGGVDRGARAVAAAASGAIGLVLVAGAVVVPADGAAVLWCYEAVLVATAVALLAALRWGRSQSALTSLVIELGDVPGKGSLTAALARAVGDPSLLVGYGLGDGRYADERGRPILLPEPDADRAVTTLEFEGAPDAVLVHDSAALRAPGLSEAVAAAVRLALENVRLQDEIRERVRDVEASRARLLQARDTERRRLETRLRAGVGRRLTVAAQALGELETDPDELISALLREADRTRVELRRFAAGLHPRDLPTGGLAAALPELAAGAPLPVAVTVDCGRLDERLEVAAWFVCAEALTNVVKHSGAARAAVGLERRDGWLVLTVDDDGRGGADPAAGRGLRGLAARVEATGGRLQIGARPGGGTRLCARLPVQERT
jgi:signal transduction histidine kinase